MRISDWSSDVCSSDLRYAEAARRACGRTHADAACLRRRQGIAGYAILVASNGGTLKRLIGILSGDAQRPAIDESEMRVSAARNDVCATFLYSSVQCLGFCIFSLFFFLFSVYLLFFFFFFFSFFSFFFPFLFSFFFFFF